MKTVLLLLLLPALGYGQTIHVKDKKIVYEGKENLGRPMKAVTTAELASMLGVPGDHQGGGQVGASVAVNGSIRLHTTFPLKRYVNYTFKLTPLDSGYKYLIDNVYYTEQERGRQIDTLSSEKMLEKMGDTGDIVGDTEKILNETDMRFQKLIAVLRSEMKRVNPASKP
ncbi:MAG: hypothetical protein ACXVBZ_06195 [Flavisolibacter sp.]